MNTRRLLRRLCIVAAIAMVVAALTYRGEAPSQAAAKPPVLESKQEMRNERNDSTVDTASHRQQQQQHFSEQELSERSARLLEQERVARLQSRL